MKMLSLLDGMDQVIAKVHTATSGLDTHTNTSGDSTTMHEVRSAQAQKKVCTHSSWHLCLREAAPTTWQSKEELGFCTRSS